jgi:hypothetical protein
MAQNTRQELGRAFELIKQDKVTEAVQILKPITEAEPDNADAWWLLANASTEARDARRALIEVLKINPAYPKARQLLDQLNERFPPRDDELMMMMDIQEEEVPLPSGTPEAFDESAVELEDFEFEEEAEERRPPKSEIDDLLRGEVTGKDEFGMEEEEDPFADLLLEKPPRRSASRTRLLLLLILLVVLVGVAGWFLLGSGEETEEADTNSQTNTTTASFTEVTGETVNAQNAVLLEEVRSAVQSDVQAVTAGGQVQTFYARVTGGYALVARICGQPDPSLPRIASEGMNAVARRVGPTPAVHPGLAMVGVSVEACGAEGNDVLYRALSPLEAAITLSNNPNDPTAIAAFRSSWVVSY